MPKHSPALLMAILSALLVLATIIPFGQIYRHDFVNFDDTVYITENSHILQGLTGENVRWAFTTIYANFWHPLTWLSHMLDVELFGCNPSGHHSMNLLIHILNALLLFIVFAKMTGNIYSSAFVAFLFAIHPLHVESVAWASERKDVLSIFFWMLTMAGYVRYTRTRSALSYSAVIFFYLCGMLSKPMLVTLPFVLLLLDYWPLKRIDETTLQHFDLKSFWRANGHLLKEKIPLFAIIPAVSWIAYHAQQAGGAITSTAVSPLTDRLANALVAYWTYLYKTLLPYDMAVFYPYNPDIPLWQSGGALLILLAVTVAVLGIIKRHPYAAVGWFWYLGTLVPVIGLVSVGAFAMADRYTYVTTIGLYMIVAWGIPDILSHWKSIPGKSIRLLIFPFAATVILVYMFITYQQVGVWKNSITLFRHAIKTTHGNFLAHDNLGTALSARGHLDEAIRHYRKSIAINPAYAEPYNNLGSEFLAQGALDQAIDYLQKADRLRPDNPQIVNNLGVAFFRRGETGKALAYYRRALQIDPLFVGAHVNISEALASNGQMDKAIEHLQLSVRLQPDNAYAQTRLRQFKHNRKAYGETIHKLQSAIQQNPDDPDLHNLLGNAYVHMSLWGPAIHQYETALQAAPENYQVMKNIASAYYLRKKYNMAAMVLKKIVAANPADNEICYTIATLYALQNNKTATFEWLRQAAENGFNRWDRLKSDKAFQSIINTEEYEKFREKYTIPNN